ncbi:MAG: RnfH family protein [Thiobacillaceae bacterium]|nr:RnfH family protein [Thiobacillaceae bacterium]MDW8323320.1 RnfH family protein [Burkholderiales bacterium]
MSQIRVEVVYARPDRVKRVSLTLPEGATVQQAIEQSGILDEFPDIDLAGRNKVGVWNKLVKPDQVLRDQDRVEIYRPLIADPKEVRKQRAAEGKAMKKGGGELKPKSAEAAATTPAQGQGDEP